MSDEQRQQQQVEGALHAVDEMMTVVDGFEAYVINAAGRDRSGVRYRLNLLWIHAFCALMIAPLMSLTGRDGLNGPSFAFLRTLPGTPYSLSALIGAGGLVLGLGCIFRAKRVESVGLALLMLFYASLSVSFAVPGIQWLTEMSPVKPPLYGPVVYGHLTVIMAVHIWALMVRRREERAMAALAQPATPVPTDAPQHREVTGLEGGQLLPRGAQ